MAALNFPASPTNGQHYPPTPVDGIPQYTWDGEKWTTMGGNVSGGSGGGGIPATAPPLADITPPQVGVASAYAREDHRHPVDLSLAATTLPLMDGTAAIGASIKYSKEDHVHPTDTSRASTAALAGLAPLVSPVFTGNPQAPTPAPGDADTSLATTAFVTTALAGATGSVPASALPLIDATPALVGVSVKYAREDHVHPTDTTRAAVSAVPGPATVNPLMDSAAAVGTTTKYAREDHVHPTDTSRAAVSAIPAAATVAPLALGSAAVGVATKYAREDHVHPTITAATAAEYVANSQPARMLTPGAVWGAAVAATLTETTSTATPNLSAANDFIWTLGGAGRTLANQTNAKAGQKGLIILLPGSAGTITTWGTNYKFPGGIKPTLTASGVDIISYVVGGDAATMYCTFSKGFA